MTADPRAAARQQLVRLLAAAIVRDMLADAAHTPEDRTHDAPTVRPAGHARGPLRALQQRQPAPHVD
jgi:hypothetical protein